jgi:hypothetical protein
VAPETPIINFRAQWSFKRDNPVGKERAEGTRVIPLSKRELLPIVKMLELDSQRSKKA